ncbi:hypothetical protein O4H49_04390 [Kiloniella laminariae]|uniref:Uncharacterized protein n=1 Tax=Kiloniella laminariae TaxID=454162 RepID=A0ABT4LFX5_9PROT|nr:hypothetical protein [Kiloniella laminariae]MCZ4280004.1 hypothetical protein [Kiloniella laminariae]
MSEYDVSASAETTGSGSAPPGHPHDKPQSFPHQRDGDYASGPASTESGIFYARSEEGRDQEPGTVSHYLNNPAVAGGEQNPTAAEGIKSQQDADGFVRLPGQDASPEEVDAFYAALGVPESPEGYELHLPKDLEVEGSEEQWGQYRSAISELSHALGLSPQQAQALADLDLQAKSQSMENLQVERERYLKQQIDDTLGTLRQEWGGNLDANVRTANRALRAFGGSELEAVLNEAGVLNDPVVLRAFHKAGLSLVEDSSPGGAGATRRNRSAAEILYPSSTKEG